LSSPKYSPGYYKHNAEPNSNSYPYTNPATIQNGSRVFGIDSKNPSYFKNGTFDPKSSALNAKSSSYTSPINSGYKAQQNYNNFSSGANSPAIYNRRTDQENSYQSPVGFNRSLAANEFS